MQTELINGRTPDEIKHDLEWSAFTCEDTSCYDCKFADDCEDMKSECEISRNALALIERLEAAQPKWISVKERLPKNEESVLVTGWREGISGKLWPVVMTAFHMDGKMLAQDSCFSWSDGNVDMKYDEDADDFIIPEGWFEDVQCADEFSMLYDIRVTHWMLLPEPPKEDK